MPVLRTNPSSVPAKNPIARRAKGNLLFASVPLAIKSRMKIVETSRCVASLRVFYDLLCVASLRGIASEARQSRYGMACRGPAAGHDLRLREVASFRRAGASHHLWTFVAYSWTFVFFNMNYHVIGHELFNNYLFMEIRVCNTNKRIFFGRGSRPCGLHPCLISVVTP